MFERRWMVLCAALALVAGAAFSAPAEAAGRFPDIPIWAYAGSYEDLAHTTYPYTILCAGAHPGMDSVGVTQMPRTVTVRFIRDRVAEARPDFGGYRIYRVINEPDSTKMVLVRRYSVQPGDEITWFMSKVNPATLQFECQGSVVYDSIATFLDPDSSGRYVKVCPLPDVRANRCLTDSVFRVIAPPGPHDGFLTYYAVNYELFNTGLEGTYEEMFVPDTLGVYGPCTDPADHRTCPNLNNKLANVSPGVYPTGGSQPDLEHVLVVPNPYRATEEWDLPGEHDVHFINLPDKATIKIYTVAGDLVTTLEHIGRPPGSTVSQDFERWNLKNSYGHDVSSGIYMFRVVSDIFAFQGRFIVIR